MRWQPRLDEVFAGWATVPPRRHGMAHHFLLDLSPRLTHHQQRLEVEALVDLTLARPSAHVGLDFTWPRARGPPGIVAWQRSSPKASLAALSGSPLTLGVEPTIAGQRGPPSVARCRPPCRSSTALRGAVSESASSMRPWSRAALADGLAQDGFEGGVRSPGASSMGAGRKSTTTHPLRLRMRQSSRPLARPGHRPRGRTCARMPLGSLGQRGPTWSRSSSNTTSAALRCAPPFLQKYNPKFRAQSTDN